MKRMAIRKLRSKQNVSNSFHSNIITTSLGKHSDNVRRELTTQNQLYKNYLIIDTTGCLGNPDFYLSTFLYTCLFILHVLLYVFGVDTNQLISISYNRYQCSVDTFQLIHFSF